MLNHFRQAINRKRFGMLNCGVKHCGVKHCGVKHCGVNTFATLEVEILTMK